MPEWENYRTVLENIDVRSAMRTNIGIVTGTNYDAEAHRRGFDPFSKTYWLTTINGQEPESIDLFDLQKWFDDNREYIDGLKKELEDKNER